MRNSKFKTKTAEGEGEMDFGKCFFFFFLLLKKDHGSRR